MGIWAYAKKIWPSGVSSKRASKMQLHSKVIAQNLFSPQKKPCILPYKGENINSMFSRLVIDLTQEHCVTRPKF